MEAVKIYVEDGKSQDLIKYLKNLKKDLVKKIEIFKEKNELDSFNNLSLKSFEKIWDNKEDSIYDRFLSKIWCNNS